MKGGTVCLKKNSLIFPTDHMFERGIERTKRLSTWGRGSGMERGESEEHTYRGSEEDRPEEVGIE